MIKYLPKQLYILFIVEYVRDTPINWVCKAAY